MFAFVFRGFFLVGVLSWYSTSVWNMIDVYFKNRFDSYLRAEYDKNPHMLADLKAYRAAAGKETPDAPMAEPEEHLNEVLQACSVDLCPVTGHEDDLGKGKPSAASKEASSVGLVKPETTTSITIVTGAEEGSVKVEASPEAISGRSKNDSKKKKSKKKTRRSQVADAVKVEEEKTTKKRLKTITLTKRDFDSTRIKVTPQDFAEFDRDEEAHQDEEEEADTILVSELPFKPKADIGNLKRVSPDEFCPVTLDEEFSCEETERWP